MKKVRILIIIAIIGIILIITGVLTGGSYSAKLKKDGIVFNDNNNIETIINNDIKIIDIESKYLGIDIESGDHFKITYNNNYVEVLKNGNKLEIINNKEVENGYVNLNPFDIDKNNEIKITIPKNINLDELIIDSKVGNIDIENITSKNVNITNNTGNVELNEIISANITIKNNVGNTDIEEVSTDILNIINNTGAIEVSDSLVNKLDTKIDTGNIEIDSDTFENEYNLDLKTNLGSVEVNKQKHSNVYKINNNTKKYINAFTNKGVIKLEFEN